MKKTQSDLTYKHDGSIYDTDSTIKFYVTEKVTSNTSEELNSLFVEIKAESIEVVPEILTFIDGKKFYGTDWIDKKEKINKKKKESDFYK
jgi:hypothetical protein